MSERLELALELHPASPLDEAFDTVKSASLSQIHFQTLMAILERSVRATLVSSPVWAESQKTGNSMIGALVQSPSCGRMVFLKANKPLKRQRLDAAGICLLEPGHVMMEHTLLSHPSSRLSCAYLASEVVGRAFPPCRALSSVLPYVEYGEKIWPPYGKRISYSIYMNVHTIQDVSKHPSCKMLGI